MASLRTSAHTGVAISPLPSFAWRGGWWIPFRTSLSPCHCEPVRTLVWQSPRCRTLFGVGDGGFPAAHRIIHPSLRGAQRRGNLPIAKLCLAWGMVDSLRCGEATAVATCHRHVAKSRLSNPPSKYPYAEIVQHLLVLDYFWWGRTDSNHRSETQQIYSLSPLSTRELPHIQFLFSDWIR